MNPLLSWPQYGGLEVIESTALTKTIYQPVAKTCLEWLLSWLIYTCPYTPWRSYRLEPCIIPDPEVYIINNIIFAHPVTMARIRSELRQSKERDNPDEPQTVH